jgi:membrane protease YdiL (CAAX protease family)
VTAGLVWVRIAATCAVAGALAALTTPGGPAAIWPTSDRLLLGLLTGVALFSVVARVGPPLSLALVGVLVLAAGAEEVIWRWFVLGALLAPAGTAAALVASACAFGAVHPGRRALHTGTGLAFGAVYLLTGSLLATWGAHAAYNLCVAVAARRAPPRAA